MWKGIYMTQFWKVLLFAILWAKNCAIYSVEAHGERASSCPPKSPEFLEEFAWHLILINHSYATCVESVYCTILSL